MAEQAIMAEEMQPETKVAFANRKPYSQEERLKKKKKNWNNY